MLLFVASAVAYADPCWFTMYVHVAKTGGSFDFTAFNPTRQVRVTTDEQLVELTATRPASPLDELNRRLAIVVRQNDGCLLHNVTLAWAKRVAADYKKIGCPTLVWTLVRDPVAHFLSLFREEPAVASAKRLGLWSSTVFARQGLTLTADDKAYIARVQEFVARNLTGDRYAAFAAGLARPRLATKPFAYQSMRLLPIWSKVYSGPIWPQYVANACPTFTTGAVPDDDFVLKSLRSFDLIGLTELRSAVLVRVAQELRIPVKDDSPFYTSDCRVVDPRWSKAQLPPFLTRVLPMALNDELRFYRLVRDEFWCKLYGVRFTVSKVLLACPHTWDFESFKCPT